MPNEEKTQMLPCEQEKNITEIKDETRAIKEEQSSIRSENRQIIRNQETLVLELKKSFERLEGILMADVEHRKDIQQLHKESDLLFEKVRNNEHRVEKIEIRNAKVDGMGIVEDFPEVWNWYQQEKGWRRFIPAAMACLAWMATILSFLMKAAQPLVQNGAP